jgi:hypothetical protein
MSSIVHIFHGAVPVFRLVDIPDYNASYPGSVQSIERLPSEPIGTAVLTLTGLVAGSDIVVLDAGTTTERVNVDANAGTTYAFSYGYFAGGGGDVDICVFKAGYVPFYQRTYPLGSVAASLPIVQVPDRNYSNP